MDLRIAVEPHLGASYSDLLAVAQAADDLGFDGFFRSDHYLTTKAGGGLPGPTDAWITLAGLARETGRIRLGTLVSPVTFRLPGVLAIQAAQVDAMSGGRVEVGLGTGWFEQEHTAYGIPFPDKRFGILEEYLQVVTGLWRTPVGQNFDFSGSHFRLTESPALPKPLRHPHPPIILGGAGARRMPRLAARFADEFNAMSTPAVSAVEMHDRVRRACLDIGRAPDSLTYSTSVTVCCGRTPDELRRREEAMAPLGPSRRSWLSSGPNELAEALSEMGEQGISRIYLRIFDLTDLQHLEVIASDVMRQLEPSA